MIHFTNIIILLLKWIILDNISSPIHTNFYFLIVFLSQEVII